MPSITVQPELLLERILSLEIVRVTERAAVSSARLRGHGKEKASDQAAVDAMAAGVTLKKDALGAFRAFLEDALAASVGVARRDSALPIDGAVSAGGFNFSLADMLSRAGPYGAGNPEPLLVLPAHTITYADPVGESHVQAAQCRRA